MVAIIIDPASINKLSEFLGNLFKKLRKIDAEWKILPLVMFLGS